MTKSIDATIKVLKSWGNTPDRTARTQNARDAQLARFLVAVLREHPDVSPEAAAKMADARMRAHYLLMAKKSAQARAARAAAKKAGTGGEAA